MNGREIRELKRRSKRAFAVMTDAGTLVSERAEAEAVFRDCMRRLKEIDPSSPGHTGGGG